MLWFSYLLSSCNILPKSEHRDRVLIQIIGPGTGGDSSILVRPGWSSAWNSARNDFQLDCCMFSGESAHTKPPPLWSWACSKEADLLKSSSTCDSERQHQLVTNTVAVGTYWAQTLKEKNMKPCRHAEVEKALQVSSRQGWHSEKRIWSNLCIAAQLLLVSVVFPGPVALHPENKNPKQRNFSLKQ